MGDRDLFAGLCMRYHVDPFHWLAPRFVSAGLAAEAQGCSLAAARMRVRIHFDQYDSPEMN